MKKVAIIERIEKYEEGRVFESRYILDSSFKKIADELDILLIPVVSENNLDEICNMCDGLILTGSRNDVHPKYYNEKPISEKSYDKFDEYSLVKNIVEVFASNNKPIFGICAGIQELNVIFGGSLNQLILNHNLKNKSKHSIRLDVNSFLYKVYNTEYIEVNSYHSQSIKDLAPNFNITAISNDGTIEGIEKGNIIGVQWHPEALHDIKLFRRFIEEFFHNK